MLKMPNNGYFDQLLFLKKSAKQPVLGPTLAKKYPTTDNFGQLMQKLNRFLHQLLVKPSNNRRLDLCLWNFLPHSPPALLSEHPRKNPTAPRKGGKVKNKTKKIQQRNAMKKKRRKKKQKRNKACCDPSYR